MKTLLVLGGGTAGTMMANKLAATLPDDSWQIVVVDRDDEHVYQPGLLFVPFGQYRPDELVRPRHQFFHARVKVVNAEIDTIDAKANVVSLQGGETLPYDVLIIATGSVIHPEWTEGLTGPWWGTDALDFYTVAGSTALAKRLESFKSGRLVVHITDMPIKCPVAPLEFVLLADAYFTKRGIRDDVELIFVTPLDGAFTKPIAAAAFGSMMADRNIEVVTEFNVAEVL
ncbi:MAG: sulfide:quinone oxidoreductase, partial [Kiritimatiellia bacterium]